MTSHAWTTTQDAADRLGAAQVKEVSFDKNSDKLTDAQKAEIRTAVQEAAQKGNIDEVKILAWSDKEYPTENGKQTKEEVGLAKNRIKHLRAFLKDELKVKSIDTHNMAERPNALEKMFNTGIFDLKAQASKGVVMIFRKR